MRIKRLNDTSTFEVVEFLIHQLENLDLDKIFINEKSEDINDITFIIEAYDYSIYEKCSKFFDVLNNLNIKWYFYSGRDLYLECHIHEIAEDTFKKEYELLYQTKRYNL